MPPALLGSCNDQAKQLHNSPSGHFNFFALLVGGMDSHYTVLCPRRVLIESNWDENVPLVAVHTSFDQCINIVVF